MKSSYVPNTFNAHFEHIVESLDLYNWKNENDFGINHSNESVLKIVTHKYGKPPSIQIIQQKSRIFKKFSFEPVSERMSPKP